MSEDSKIKDCVCSGCGGKIEYIDTVDNAGNPTKWLACKKCSKFCNGVPKKIFEIAEKLFFKERELYYSDSYPKDWYENKYETVKDINFLNFRHYHFATSNIGGWSYFLLRLERLKEGDDE